MARQVCCDAPHLDWRWGLSLGPAGEPLLSIFGMRCPNCGAAYVFDKGGTTCPVVGMFNGGAQLDLRVRLATATEASRVTH